MLTFGELSIAKSIVKMCSEDRPTSSESLFNQLKVNKLTFNKIRAKLSKAGIIRVHGQDGITRNGPVNLLTIYTALGFEIEDSYIGELVKQVFLDEVI